MGEYFCAICKFHDDDIQKRKQYHCDDCGICRLGGRENFFHCKKCDACYSVELRDKHSCVENSMRHHCAICQEFLFDSLEATTVMECGHTMHSKCLVEMINQKIFKCPICSQSLIDMSKMQREPDEEANLQENLQALELQVKRLIAICKNGNASKAARIISDLQVILNSNDTGRDDVDTGVGNNIFWPLLLPSLC